MHRLDTRRHQLSGGTGRPSEHRSTPVVQNAVKSALTLRSAVGTCCRMEQKADLTLSKAFMLISDTCNESHTHAGDLVSSQACKHPSLGLRS